MNIGLSIKKCRKLRNVTLDELSIRTKLSKSYLSLIESGKRRPSIDVVNSISVCIGIPMHLLIYLSTDTEDVTSLNAELDAKLKELLLRLIKNGD